MKMEYFGALISRALGLGFIVMGIASAMPWVIQKLRPSAPPAIGWTSYSPLSTDATFTSATAEMYIDNSFLITCWIQVFAGLLLLLFSKHVGRVLAKGIENRQESQ